MSDHGGMAYSAIDKARRKLLVPADRFRQMLLDQIAAAGGAPPPDAETESLKALVDAFVAAGRGPELETAANDIVRTRSLGYEF